MPGIIGIIGKELLHHTVRQRNQIIKLMSHEHFYTSGAYSNDRLNLWIGWTIHQDSFSDCLPIWNESKDICLIFSGENFSDPEQLHRLKSKGHTFKADNAAYLVHMYEDIGLDFLNNLNGIFCGVLIDTKEHKIILFNDRFGLGRIYYHEETDGLLFASEAKALLKLLPSLRKLDMTSFAEYFTCGCALQYRTLFSGISLLPGGSAWKYSPEHKPLKEKYFQQEIWENQTPLRKEEYYEKLKATWNASCRVISIADKIWQYP